ncbi:MAG TPA: 16S rRNA (cytidine(1402)-2'-O)-methyltransferase [Ignavibacteria bacterium]|nr:16S rRNA (cytidine(1402)-2'-O)-methyltransferase [Ignavibacteria bacterium]
MSEGILNIVTTPIGNYADMTLRALRILKESDYIICEEYKEANKLLKFFELDKELFRINEHNEENIDEEIINNLLTGKKISLISDGGTPLFADPGNYLLHRCIELNIKVDFIGGANSVLTAVVLCGFNISRFRFVGFLSPKNDIRKKELDKLKFEDRVLIILDAPYRLIQMITDLKNIMPERNIFLGCNLTSNDEKQFRGTAENILNLLEENYKAEFVLILDKINSKKNDNNI